MFDDDHARYIYIYIRGSLSDDSTSLSVSDGNVSLPERGFECSSPHEQHEYAILERRRVPMVSYISGRILLLHLMLLLLSTLQLISMN